MNSKISQSISQLIANVDKHSNPLFKEEVDKRLKRNHIKNPNQLFKRLSCLMAYSQQARSQAVTDVIESKYLHKALCGFDIAKAAELNPCDVVDKHWQKINGIRQKNKIFQIVMLARKMHSDDSIFKLLLKSDIPAELHNEDDLIEFWQQFNVLKKSIKNAQVPFFRESTSLLHLLVSLGYDCVKPDSAVMKAAFNIGIVSSTAIGKGNLEKVVTTIQNYSIENKRALPPSVLDLYFLIHGGQTEAKKYVSNEYYGE